MQANNIVDWQRDRGQHLVRSNRAREEILLVLMMSRGHSRRVVGVGYGRQNKRQYGGPAEFAEGRRVSLASV
jgi:hypothetical protein